MTYSSRPGSSTSATALVHLVHARVDEGGALVVDQELVELKVRPLVQADGRGDPVDAVDDLVYAGHASQPFAIECKSAALHSRGGEYHGQRRGRARRVVTAPRCLGRRRSRSP